MFLRYVVVSSKQKLEGEGVNHIDVGVGVEKAFPAKNIANAKLLRLELD